MLVYLSVLFNWIQSEWLAEATSNLLIKLELILESKFAIEISSYRRKQYDNDTDGQKC